MTEREECKVCHGAVPVRKDGQLRVHYLNEETLAHAHALDGNLKVGDPCPGGAEPQPKGIEDKARRYIAEGRVRVMSVTPTEVLVHVRGSKPEPYAVRVLSSSSICPCEAKTWRCAHVVAALLVTDPPEQTFSSDSPVPDDLDALLTAPVHHVSEDSDFDWGRFDGD